MATDDHTQPETEYECDNDDCGYRFATDAPVDYCWECHHPLPARCAKCGSLMSAVTYTVHPDEMSQITYGGDPDCDHCEPCEP
jgi:hypothetical protein